MTSLLDLITKVFYSWVQVRNYGALDKINHEKAENHDRTVTLTKAFAAWRYAMELVSERNSYYKRIINITGGDKTTKYIERFEKFAASSIYRTGNITK